VKDLTATSKRAQREECGAYEIQYWVPVEWKEGMWVSWWPGIKRFKGRTVALSYDLASIQHLIEDYGLNEETL
jgi:hypothetical protein